MAQVTHPTSSIKCSSDVAIVQWYKSIYVFNISISTMWKHGATSRESKQVSLNLNPILNCLFNTEFPMRNVIVPSIVPTFRPLEGILIAWRCRNQAAEHVLFLRAVPLPVLHHILWELPCLPRVLAGGILAVLELARWEFLWRKRGFVEADLVVGLEIQVSTRGSHHIIAPSFSAYEGWLDAVGGALPSPKNV